MSNHTMTRVWNHSKAKGSQRLVLIAIADSAHNDDGTGAWPSMRTIATKVRLSRRQTQDHVKALTAIGELKVEERKGHSNTYTVLVGCEAERTPSDVGRCAVDCTPGVKRIAHPGVKPSSPRSIREPKRKQSASSSLERDVRWVDALTEEWRSSRAAQGLERWHDSTALKYLRDAASLALKSCERQDVEKAMRSHVEEDWADTRELGQWAAEARDERLTEDRQREVAQQRAAEHEATRVRLEAEWAERADAGDLAAMERLLNSRRSACEECDYKTWCATHDAERDRIRGLLDASRRVTALEPG